MEKKSCFLYLLLAIIFTNLCFAQGISTQNLSDKVWENLVQFEESQSPKVLTEEAKDLIIRGKWTWFMDATRNIVFTDDIKIENNRILGDPQLSDFIVKNRSIISQDYLNEFNVTLPHAYETWDFENDVFSYLNLDFYLDNDNSLLLDIEKEARQYFLNEYNQRIVQPDLIEISYTRNVTSKNNSSIFTFSANFDASSFINAPISSTDYESLFKYSCVIRNLDLEDENDVNILICFTVEEPFNGTIKKYDHNNSPKYNVFIRSNS